jgi:hypothetical protein
MEWRDNSGGSQNYLVDRKLDIPGLVYTVVQRWLILAVSVIGLNWSLIGIWSMTFTTFLTL